MARIVSGRYAIPDKSVAGGGFADVYKGSDLANDGAPVAVKLLRRSAEHETLLPRFFDREVSALRALHHENIVQLLDAGIEPDTNQYFLILEWVPTDLGRRLAEAAPEGWDDFAEAIALPLLAGMAHAHDRRTHACPSTGASDRRR